MGARRVMAVALMAAGIVGTGCGGDEPAAADGAEVPAELSEVLGQADDLLGEIDMDAFAEDPEAAAAAFQEQMIDSFADEGSWAVVTVGDERWEFADLYCVTMFGSPNVQTLGGDVRLEISIPPDGWETSGEEWDPPSIWITADEPYFSYRSPTYDEGDNDTGVTVTANDGYSASGTAIFGAGFEEEPVAGSFEFSCPKP